MKQTVVHMMQGLGDSIYQRAFIKAHPPGEFILETSWPELFEDIPGVRFLFPQTNLRTQMANARRQPGGRWVSPRSSAAHMSVRYGKAELSRSNIMSALQGQFGWAPAAMDLPDWRADASHVHVHDGARIAVVRPVTIRKEWKNPARNPHPGYIFDLARKLMADGYHVISVADLRDGQEWAIEPLPPAHQQFHRGELHIKALLGLIQRASLVVGGVGWIVPACLAAGTPIFVVMGGELAHNAPEKIGLVAPNGWAMPDRPCYCDNKKHDCDKRISNLMQQFEGWRHGRNL